MSSEGSDKTYWLVRSKWVVMMEAHHLSLCNISSSHSEHPCGLCDYSLMKQPTRSHVSRTEAEHVLRSRWRSNSGSDLRVWNARLRSCRLYGWFRRGCGPMGSEFLFGAHREHTQFPCRAETGTKRFIAGESIPGELWQRI